VLRLRIGLAAAFYPIADPQVRSAGPQSAFNPCPLCIAYVHRLLSLFGRVPNFRVCDLGMT